MEDMQLQRDARANVAGKTPRQAVAEAVAALMQLVLVLGIDEDPATLAINYDGMARRIDIGRIDASGQRLHAWLAGVNADVAQPAHVGEPVTLPTQGTVQ